MLRFSWFDVDTVLLNQNIPWTAFLPPGDGFQDVHFLVSKDMNGLNIGIFFVRVNDWTIKMLSDVLALPSLRPDVEIGHNAEQDAMRWVLEQSRNREHVLYQPQHWYNAYEHADSTHPLHNGDLLVHFAGYGDKGPAMSKWLDRLEGENADLLQPPMAHTTYPHQVREYWARLRRAREVFREVDEHRKEEWGHLSDQDAIKRVEDAEKILKDHLWNEAQDGERITKDTSTVKDSLEAMDKKREENEKKKKEKEGGKKEGEEERRKKKREKSQEGRS